MNKITLLKIIGGMIISFVIAFIATRTIFINSSPMFRTDLSQYLILKAEIPISLLSRVFILMTQRTESIPESSFTQALIQSLQSTPFSNISPGIYTKENSLTSYLLIKENDVSWQNYSMNNNGKQIVIRIPKGEQLPQQNIISSITP